MGERLRIAWSLSRLERKTRRLGLRTPWDFEWLAVARGYLFPGESLGTAVGVPVSRKEFSDLELTAALLSPSLEWNEQAVCRGALTLAAQLAFVDPKRIVHEALRARGEAVVRHIAWLGREIDPESPRWRDLLLLPSDEGRSSPVAGRSVEYCVELLRLDDLARDGLGFRFFLFRYKGHRL